MVAQIKLKELTGIKVGNETVNTSNLGDFQSKINSLGDGELVFAGKDYGGILDNSGDGILAVYLGRSKNYFIEGIKVKNSDEHSLSDDAKDADIKITLTNPQITEIDNSWYKRRLDVEKFDPANSRLKFCELGDYDLPDKYYVDINFA